MKFINNFFSNRMSKELPKPIGSWNIKIGEKNINNIIVDLPNKENYKLYGRHKHLNKQTQNTKYNNNSIEDISKYKEYDESSKI